MEKGLDIPIHVDGASGAIFSPQSRMGFPIGTSSIDQHKWTQIRTRSSWSRLDHLETQRRSSWSVDLSCQLLGRWWTNIQSEFMPNICLDRWYRWVTGYSLFVVKTRNLLCRWSPFHSIERNTGWTTSTPSTIKTTSTTRMEKTIQSDQKEING